MANVKVTSLTELSTEQLDQFTWFLASHRTDDEQTSNKVNFASLSTHLCADLSIYEMQDAIKDATGGQSERIAQLTADVRELSGKTEALIAQYTDVKIDVDQKQDKLLDGENIKTINGQSILGSGDLPIAGGGSIVEPENYLKTASVNGNTLNITAKTGTTTQEITFQPAGGSIPEGYEQLQSDVEKLNSDVPVISSAVVEHGNKLAQMPIFIIQYGTINSSVTIQSESTKKVEINIDNSEDYELVNINSISFQSSDLNVDNYYILNGKIYLTIINSASANITSTITVKYTYLKQKLI